MAKEDVEIRKEYPPNIDRIRQFLNPPTGALFAYNGIIYSPDSDVLYPDLIEHEKVHFTQQDGYPDEWWERYLQDPDFRLSQELEAYSIQYQYLKRIMSSKDLKLALYDMAQALSNDYKLSLSHQEAETKIRKFG